MPVSKFIKKMMFSRQLDFKEGKFEMLGIRGAILPIRTLTTFIEEMYKEQGEDVFDMLFETGKEHGRIGVEKLGKKHSVPKREFLNQIVDSGNIMGLGKAEIEVFDPSNGNLRIKLEKSPFEEAFKDSEALDDLERPIDDFQKGIFHAMADAVFEKDVKSKQTKCSYLGDQHCEFKIKTVD